MLSLNFSMIGSPIYLIARLLTNWIAICMYSQMEYCCESPSKIISNGHNERKNIWHISLNIDKHDNNHVKTLIFAVALW